MAFYAILLVYWLVRRPLTTIVLTGTAGWAVVSTALANVDLVQLFFLRRFVAGGLFLRDNRVSGLFTALYEDFWNADVPTRLFGSAHDVAILVNTGTFSYKVLIYAYGMFGVAALVAFLAAAVTSVSRGKAAFTLLAVFLLSIYQRPNVMELPYLLVLLGGVVQLRHLDDLAQKGDSNGAVPAGMAT
jgi:hypothetical protein